MWLITDGLSEELIDAGYIVGVEPGDAAGLRRAIVDLLENIVDLLENPEKADMLAQKGYDLVQERHNHDFIWANVCPAVDRSLWVAECRDLSDSTN